MLNRKRVVVATIVLILAVAVPSVAFAANPFEDVEDGRWFSEPVDWAFNNGITTGTSPTTFDGERSTNRYELITVINRYHNELVEPQLEALEGRITELENAQTAVWDVVDANAVDDWTGTVETLELATYPRASGYLVVDYIVELDVDDDSAADFPATAYAAIGRLGSETSFSESSLTVDLDAGKTIHLRAVVPVEPGEAPGLGATSTSTAASDVAFSPFLTASIAGDFPPGGLLRIERQTLTAVFVGESWSEEDSFILPE